ncbi:MAG: MOSC domain-containing protein [Thermomicrobiales bacterium]
MGGSIQGIYIAPAASVPMQSLEEVRAIAGVGLEGDRYALGIGFYTQNPTTPGAREITLIAQESIDAAATAAGVPFAASESRRNLLTRGVDLNSLFGQRFSIGSQVICEGVRECTPCVHLDELTGKQLMPHLVRTGGMRARIVTGGVIRIGDDITIIAEAEGPVHGRGEW